MKPCVSTNQADEAELIPPLTDLYYALRSQVSDLRPPVSNSPSSRYNYDESYALSILTRWSF